MTARQMLAALAAAALALGTATTASAQHIFSHSSVSVHEEGGTFSPEVWLSRPPTGTVTV